MVNAKRLKRFSDKKNSIADDSPIFTGVKFRKKIFTVGDFFNDDSELYGYFEQVKTLVIGTKDSGFDSQYARKRQVVTEELLRFFS